jgi:hypothetical protein
VNSPPRFAAPIRHPPCRRHAGRKSSNAGHAQCQTIPAHDSVQAIGVITEATLRYAATRRLRCAIFITHAAPRRRSTNADKNDASDYSGSDADCA